MAGRKEDTTPYLTNTQCCSWMPSTPAKPHFSTRQLICDNWQENHLVQANRLITERLTEANQVNQPNCTESERLQMKYLQKMQCHSVPACPDWTNFSNSGGRCEVANSLVHRDALCNSYTWQAGDATISHLCVDDVSNFNFCQLKNAVNCRFCGKDLAVTAGTNAAENAVSQNDFSTTRQSVSPFYPQIEDNYSKTSTGKTLAGAVDSFLGTKFMDKFNSTPDALMDETSIPSQILFYLNSPAITTKDAATVNSSSSQLKPITPEKTNKLESMQENDMLCLNKNEVFMEKDSQENKITRAEAGRVRKKVTHSKSIGDKFCATTSTQLEENHNHDKVGNKEADLTKTPQQKPRRRKHRPKVVIEGRAKSTSNRNKKRPVAPQKTRTVRKKSVQRKGLIIIKGILSEGENSGTDSSDEVPSCKDTPVRKRKYGRTKGTDKPEPKMLSGTHSYTGRSCKRSLNFNMQCPVRDESSSCRSSANSETELGPEMEVVAKENHIGAYELTSYEDHTQEEYLPRPKKQFPSPWPHENMDSMEDHMNMKPNICTRGMCETVFPNETLEKEKITEKATPNPTVCWTPKSPSNSKSSRICVTHERQIGGLKRQYMDSEEGITGMHFPEICKKKRTEKRHYRTTTSLRYSMTSSDNHIFKCLLALGSSKWIKKKRSKGPTRLRKVASLISLCQELPASSNDDAPRYREDHNIGSTKEKSSCVEALKSDICSTMTKKKRSKQNMLINSTATNTYNQQHLSSKANRPLLPITWKRISPIDSVVEKLNQLDLKAETIQKTTQKQNVFMVLNYKHEESHALVPYQRGGPVVPFDRLFDQDRSRQPRPKVDLDDETIRVWKLLLEDINNGGIDGVDGENRKWWEEERKIFSGRADSFIARMHLIQGDRRFSPWKGSVIDSVIGVFLTQNVSDHLSSSAFMSLAAHFPLKKANLAELYGETIDIVAEEPAGDLDPEEIFMLDKTSLNKPICGEDHKILKDFECDDIKTVNILRPYANNFDDIIPGEDSRGQFSETSTIGPFVSNESVTIKSMNLIGEQRELADAFSSHSSVISSQSSADSPIAETGDRTESYSSSISKEEPTIEVKPHRLSSTTSFVKLLLMAGTILQGKSEKGCEEKISDENGQMQSNRLTLNLQNEHQLAAAKPIMSFDSTSSCMRENQELECLDLSHENIKSTDNRSSRLSAAEASGVSEEFAPRTTFKEPAAVSFKAKRKLFSLNNQTSNNCQPNKNQNIVEALAGLEPIQNKFVENKKKFQGQSGITICQQNLTDVKGGSSKMSDRKEAKSSTSDPDYRPSKLVNQQKTKKGRTGKEKQNSIDWDELRKQAQERGNTWEKTNDTMDSVDWDAVRCSEVDEIARIIKDRGMNNMLAQRIKDFLNRLFRDHESTDLEWLRNIPPDKAKEFLLSIRGLGLKSVECVRLLTLHQLAFPVDTNVGRIAVRLGWVPLQPLPESLQLHLLELYPVLESIQKYLWPRLCKLDQRTLYELHYQMITFGKVFCTKNKPNCNACPMRGECRHFASAFASARLSLQAPAEKRIMNATENKTTDQKTARGMNTLQFPSPNITPTFAELEVGNTQPIVEEPTTPEPIIEAPVTPELDYTQVPEFDIENTFQDDLGEIPTIHLNIEEFNHNLQKIMQQHTEVQEEDRSKALVALNPEAASIPFPKLKNVSQLRTEHQVYELPDSHPLLEGMDKREQDDPSPYLLAIWTPGETLDSIEPPKRQCSSQESKKLCTEETCLSCNTIREAGSQTVRGTLLIPCRTAMRGSFPLNGTYFQVNEVFSDHESSLDPMDVPRKWLWNMPRRTVYFGTSIPTIFKGLSTEGIQRCFWRGFVCVRGFDRRTRAPRPLIARLHFPASKLVRRKGKIDEN